MRKLVVPMTVLLLSAMVGSSCQLAGQTKGKPVSPGELDSLLAPVALYPDSLLSQILLSAGTPAKVSELSTWLAANKSLKGTALQDAATVAGFEPSLVALSLFPQVVTTMATKLDWTTRLGQAFAADRKGVFASIQRLRTQAQNSGALKDTPQQDVESRKTQSGETVIVIEPANPQIVYVPQYNPQVVYVEEDNSADAAVAGLIGFTAGIAIGASMDNNYYYGPYGMHGGFHMYNDAWDDYYDHREDAREDWIDHRENLYEERGDRREDLYDERGDRRNDTVEQRTDRAENRREAGTASQAQRTERAQNRQETRPSTQTRSNAAQTRSTTAQTRSGATAASRGYSGDTRQANVDRTGTRSDAFSGYSSGKSERAASQRGQSSRSSAQRSGGGGGGGGRRR
jgi:hypothetical protein